MRGSALGPRVAVLRWILHGRRSFSSDSSVVCEATLPVIRIRAVRQSSRNTCWIACLRMVARHYGVGLHRDDRGLARQIGWSGIGRPRDIQVALAVFQLWDSTEDRGIGPFREVQQEIDARRPMVACVSSTRVSLLSDVLGAHYILIVGYAVARGNRELLYVIDPADGRRHTVSYNRRGLRLGGQNYFWAMTYYTSPPP